MPHFSRLTDIVTCNLTAILAEATDPQATLQEILKEMQEGVAGAKRSMETAARNAGRIETEIAEQRGNVTRWMDRAKEQLKQGDETHARQALSRKREIEDLLAGLEPQLQAAVATRNHLTTTMHALEARVADAARRLQGIAGSNSETTGTTPVTVSSIESTRQQEIDRELEELRKQL